MCQIATNNNMELNFILSAEAPHSKDAVTTAKPKLQLESNQIWSD